jgi:hypothetical protein
MIIPQEPTQSFAALNRPRAINIRAAAPGLRREPRYHLYAIVLSP